MSGPQREAESPSTGVSGMPTPASWRSRHAALARVGSRAVLFLLLVQSVHAQTTSAPDSDAAGSGATDPAVAPVAIIPTPAAEATPLSLSEVLTAVERTHPKLEAAAHKLDAASAKRFAAKGAWDPYLDLSAKSTPEGYYEHTELAASVRQATPLWGMDLYAGYRRGVGDYPVYKGELETLRGGEFHAGVAVPLWKDGPIDEARAEIQQSAAWEGSARCAQSAAKLNVRRYAATAYWHWVLAGRTVAIQAELLQTAQQRDSAIRDRVALGNAGSISIVDNQRMVLEREAKLVGAQRKFQEAALKLSLFLRDDNSLQPIVVGTTRVPTVIPEVTRMPARPEHKDIEVALRGRPELCELFGEQKAAEVAVRLAENQRAPAITVHAEVARDLGAGPDSLAPTDVIFGAKLAMPLLLRKARGKADAAQSTLAMVRAHLRGLRDQVTMDVRKARVDLSAAHRQVAVARRQLQVARALAEAEQIKLDEGASDLVVLNLRELAVAEAASLLADTLTRLQIARVDYLTALGAGV